MSTRMRVEFDGGRQGAEKERTREQREDENEQQPNCKQTSARTQARSRGHGGRKVVPFHCKKSIRNGIGSMVVGFAGCRIFPGQDDPWVIRSTDEWYSVTRVFERGFPSSRRTNLQNHRPSHSLLLDHHQGLSRRHRLSVLRPGDGQPGGDEAVCPRQVRGELHQRQDDDQDGRAKDLMMMMIIPGGW